MHCRILRSIFVLYLLNVGSSLSSSSCDNQKYLQTLLMSLGGKLALAENHWSKVISLHNNSMKEVELLSPILQVKKWKRIILRIC